MHSNFFQSEWQIRVYDRVRTTWNPEEPSYEITTKASLPWCIFHGKCSIWKAGPCFQLHLGDHWDATVTRVDVNYLKCPCPCLMWTKSRLLADITVTLVTSLSRLGYFTIKRIQFFVIGFLYIFSKYVTLCLLHKEGRTRNGLRYQCQCWTLRFFETQNCDQRTLLPEYKKNKAFFHTK